jgi:hypothetical protein
MLDCTNSSSQLGIAENHQCARFYFALLFPPNAHTSQQNFADRPCGEARNEEL